MQRLFTCIYLITSKQPMHTYLHIIKQWSDHSIPYQGSRRPWQFHALTIFGSRGLSLPVKHPWNVYVYWLLNISSFLMNGSNPLKCLAANTKNKWTFYQFRCKVHIYLFCFYINLGREWQSFHLFMKNISDLREEKEGWRSPGRGVGVAVKSYQDRWV